MKLFEHFFSKLMKNSFQITISNEKKSRKNEREKKKERKEKKKNTNISMAQFCLLQNLLPFLGELNPFFLFVLLDFSFFLVIPSSLIISNISYFVNVLLADSRTFREKEKLKINKLFSRIKRGQQETVLQWIETFEIDHNYLPLNLLLECVFQSFWWYWRLNGLLIARRAWSSICEYYLSISGLLCW